MRTHAIAIAVSLAVLLSAGALQADEVTSAMSAAESAYGSGDYREASTQLQLALASVNQKLIAMLEDALPEPPSGWTADEPKGMDSSVVGLGALTSLAVERTYRAPGGSRIVMTITANSPLLTSLRMFASNPMMAATAGQTGMKSVTTCGYDAIEHFAEDTYELHVMAGDATLISFVGSEESDIDHIRTLSSGTDCSAIVKVVE